MPGYPHAVHAAVARGSVRRSDDKRDRRETCTVQPMPEGRDSWPKLLAPPRAMAAHRQHARILLPEVLGAISPAKPDADLQPRPGKWFRHPPARTFHAASIRPR